MSKISIIVPVYKTEPYLRKCVDSILAQTHQDLEVILVDDGSPDNCGQICDEYAKKDSRIRVIHKPNGGLSDARNAGMDIMTGQYVGFVDSDDWIEPTMYETLLTLMEQFDADMAFGGVADDMEHNGMVNTLKISDYGDTPFAESKTDAMRRYFRGSWSAWDKLYRAELFQGIEYPVGEINEDEAIVLHLLNRCRRVCYTNEVFYHYMHRKGNQTITNSSFSHKKLAWMEHCRANLQYVRNSYPMLAPDAAERYLDSVQWSLSQIALSDGDFSQEIRAMRQDLWAERKYLPQVPFRSRQDKIRILLLTYAPFGAYRAIIRVKRGRKTKSDQASEGTGYGKM